MAPCGRHLREKGRLAPHGVLIGNTDSPRAGAESSASLSVLFLLLVLECPLFPVKMHPLDACHGSPGEEDIGKGPGTSWCVRVG